MIDDLYAAHAEQNHDRQADERRQSGEEEAPAADELDIRVHVVPVRPVERLDFRFFLHVSANHSHARKIFLRSGGKHAERGLNLYGKPVNHLAEIPHGHHHEGHGQQDPQR